MGFFETFWSWLEGQLSAYIGTNTALVAAALEPALMTLAVVYVMVWGYLQLTGRIDEPLVAGLRRLVLLALVLGGALILRTAGSEHGGTSQFASRLIGEREVLRRQTSRGRDREGWLGGRGNRRSTQVSEQRITELAVMASELEQLPDLTGYMRAASSSAWLRVSFRP